MTDELDEYGELLPIKTRWDSLGHVRNDGRIYGE